MGGAILGICNGFQILAESNLLPGTLILNKNNKFICEDSKLTVAKSNPIWNQSLRQNEN